VVEIASAPAAAVRLREQGLLLDKGHVGGKWIDAPEGSLVIAPGGTPHDFKNQGSVQAGFLSFTTPGGFEARMKDIENDLAAADLRLESSSPS